MYSQDSIDQQILACRQFGGAHALTMDPRLIYVDNGFSGITLAGRYGLASLLAAAGGTSPPFEYLLIDSLARLSTDLSVGCVLIEGLGAFGITVWSVSDFTNLTLNCSDLWQAYHESAA
jgi:DNA invertase Pin-like site-specific DNA recombinase